MILEDLDKKIISNNILTKEQLETKLAPVDINVNIDKLTEEEKNILGKLIEVSNIFNEIFFEQKIEGNLELFEQIKKIGNDDLSTFYKIMQGPFNVFKDNNSFIEGITKTDKAAYYPADLTDFEWEDTLNQLKKIDEKQKQEFLSPYTVIRRNYNQELEAIGYNKKYEDRLTKASDILYEISKQCSNITEKEYFRTLSNSCLNNDFTDADIRWLQLENNKIEAIMGPHEVYEDRFLGLKAAFTSFICIKNEEEFKKLNTIIKLLSILQKNLPMMDYFKKNTPTMSSQILVVDMIYGAGDARGPIQTAAFNLPNSHKIKTEFGSKKIMLYNIMEAKFNKIMVPISREILDENDFDKISYPAYFNFILMHEIGHELGISFVKDKNGNLEEVSRMLKDLYSIIEETKADVMGMYNLSYLIKNCFINDCTYIEATMSYLTSLFRSMRFGSENAHCISNIIQYNYLLKEGAIIINHKNDKPIYSIDLHKFDKSIESLLTIILTLQGAGAYQNAKDFIKEYFIKDDELMQTLDCIKNIPIDIFPNFNV